MIKINEQHLIDKVAQKTGLTKTDVNTALDTVWDVIKEELQQGNRVVIQNFARFDVVHRNAKMGRNPHTNQPLEIPAKKVVKMTVGKGLKEAVDN